MRSFKKFSLMLMLVAAFFMTGCDAQQIIDTITQIAQGVQQAAPAIRDAVNTVQGIFRNDNNNNNQAAPAAPTPTPAPTQPTETAADNPAEVFVPNATDEEEIIIPPTNTTATQQQSPNPGSSRNAPIVTVEQPANNNQSSAATQTGTPSAPDTSPSASDNAANADAGTQVPPIINEIKYALHRLKERLEANDSVSNIENTLAWLQKKFDEARAQGVEIPSKVKATHDSLRQQALKKIASADPRTSYTNLLNAAKAEMSGVSADCYNTSVRTANANGASGDGFSWPSSTRYRSQGVAKGMKQAITSGHLKPGMVVYICKNPGTDPNSLNLSNLPHWYTYLGKDANGVDRFSDQYFTDLTIEGLASNYPNRLVDEILDPYRR